MGLLGSKGEGLRGPKSRRSEDCSDAERECPDGSGPLGGGADWGRGVMVERLATSLEARDGGRGSGGSDNAASVDEEIQGKQMHTFIYHSFHRPVELSYGGNLLTVLIAIFPSQFQLHG
jgi:hypothetical protein